MKKLLFFAFLSFNIIALDQIEQAIMDSNPEQVAIALQNKVSKSGPLTERQSAKYLDLAQHMITKRYDSTALDKIWPQHKSGKIALAFVTFGIGNLAPLCIFLLKEDVTNRDLTIIRSTMAASYIISFALFFFGVKDQNAYIQKNIKLYDNALEIKQIIYDAC